MTKFSTNKEKWLDGMASWDDIQHFALFKFACEIQGSRIEKFKYEFIPWKTMNKLSRRTVTEKSEFGKTMVMKDKENNTIDLGKYEIGRIRFTGRIFDMDSKILRLGLQDKAEIGEQEGIKDYLGQNGGIRVFRNGMRVYDYGEPGNDWLKLDIHRVNMPTRRISNNQILASVLLDRTTSSDLREKTNREGFIENEAYHAFRDAIIYTVGMVENQRKIDKEEIRRHYGPTPKSEPVLANIARAKESIQRITDKRLKNDLSTYMDRIERDYKTIHDTLLRSAGAGLSLSVAVHEMDKVIRELNKVLAKGHPSEKILALVKHLARLVEGYSVAIKRGTKRMLSAHELIDQALFNFDFRFRAHKINVIFENQDVAKKAKIKCSRSHVVSSIMNILDNAIWWLEYKNPQSKKVFITVHTDSATTTMVFADNGTGFSLPSDILTEPGVTTKRDGMGLGLHIANEVMTAHGGRLVFPELGDYEVPKEFHKGAMVAFVFGGIRK